MRYLLDTNIVSDIVRNPQGQIVRYIHKVGEGRICTSIIVAAELRFGVRKSASRGWIARVEAVLAALDILPFKAPADATYATIRARLEAMGQSIGGNDLLIAAQAMTLGYTLVTNNEREFGRIADLRVENWFFRN